MSHTGHAHSHQKDPSSVEPYWKRAHHDWKFYIALFLMLAGIGIYIVTLDESVGPGPPSPPPQQLP